MLHTLASDVRVIRRYERTQPHSGSMITPAEVAAFNQLTPAQTDLLWTRSSQGVVAKGNARRKRMTAAFGWLAGAPGASRDTLEVAPYPAGIGYGWWAMAAWTMRGPF